MATPRLVRVIRAASVAVALACCLGRVGLDAQGVTVLTGIVADGSGRGVPLYARLDISGLATPVVTNATTGAYSVNLMSGRSYDITVTALVPGYRVERLSVTPSGANVRQDIALAIDANACTAPGYARSYAYRESFEASDGGWTGSGTASWAWGKPTSGPGAAHSGTRVWATNLAGAYGTAEDGDLISPAIDLSAYSGKKPVVVWSQWLKTVAPWHTGEVAVSADYGTTWATVYGPQTGNIDLAWTEKLIVLSEAYAVPGFRLRFRFHSASTSSTAPGWYVDDIGITALTTSSTVVYTEAFDASNGGYAGGGPASTWAWGEPTSGPNVAHSGTKVWATNLSGVYDWHEDSALTSPPIDLSAHTGEWPVLSWWQFLKTAGGVYGGIAGVDVSADGLQWISVYAPPSGAVDLAWAPKSVALPPAFATPRMQVRFRLTSGGYAWDLGYYIDDVSIHAASLPCQIQTGGLVVGLVRDSRSNIGLSGARVAGGLPGDAATVIAVPRDTENGPGVYVLFSSVTGAVTLTASEADHTTKTLPITVSIGGVASANFSLDPTIPPPTITAVSPSRGSTAGGSLVTLSGTNFVAGATTVSFGGAAGTSVVVTSDTTLTVVTPQGAAGAADVLVSTPGGTVTRLAGFTYAMTLYLAEGATSTFFDTRLALLNPGATATSATLTFSRAIGGPVTSTVAVPAHTRVTVNPKTITGLAAAEFSTKIESDQLLVVDRTLSWDGRGYGAHAETAIPAPALTWYLAEGATHSTLNLFYLLQNPNATAAEVRVKYLRPAGAPLEKTYTLPATSRTNIWVDVEDFPGLGLALASTDVSAVIEVLNGQPIIVERALYAEVPGQTFGAGHNSAGITAPATEWFLAEGATGPYLDLFVLLANPGDTAAQVEATYLLPDGSTVVKPYTVGPTSRFNIWVHYDDERLADTAVSTTVRSLNGVPIIVERAMWWPDGAWHEAHNSPGATTTGTRWALAEGEVNASRNLDTYILVANTSLAPADVKVTLWFEDGTSAERTFAGIAARSRFNVAVAAEFPQAAGRRFGAIVESLGTTPAQIVVERAMYWDAAGQTWAAGTNALATKLQ